MGRASRAVLRLGGFLLATGALAWGCGGSLASSPDGGGADASASSSGIGSSSSGGSSSASGSSTSSGSSGGSSASGSGSGSSGGSTSGSSGSSSSGGSSTSSSGGPSCGVNNCTWDLDCQDYCPPAPNGGTNCCDQASGVCYTTSSHICPLPVDAGCHDIYAICPINDAGESPLNPNTGSYGCDGCIQCSCGSPWCACGADSTFDYFHGTITGGCLVWVNCVIGCAGADGGLPQCAQQCAAGGGYTQQQLEEGNQLLKCMASSCGTPSTCGI